MSKNKRQCPQNDEYIPETLDNHPFFGITPDQDQKKLIDSVWKRDKKVYLINSIAGSGKTLIATALGVLMVKHKIYKKIVYITFPGIYEKTQGFLPGDLTKKSEPYFQPLYDALNKIGENPEAVCSTSQYANKFGEVFVECAVSTYMRGINIEDSFVIIDEAENADLHTLAKVISRINDSCLTMVIGHSGQCDMYDKTKSGFTACIDYQTKYHPDVCASFSLRENHRGWVSKWADLMLEEYKEPAYGFIYETTNKVNGKKYIGQHKRTMNPKDIDDSWYLGSGTALARAIAKYGKENFERKIIYECNCQQQLDYMERIFIYHYDAATRRDYYNITTGGSALGTELTEEMKQKLRHKHKPMSDEARKHMAREFSLEARQKLSQYAKRNLTGYVHSEETKRNMSAAHKDKCWIFNGDERKFVRKEDLDSYLSNGWSLLKGTGLYRKRTAGQAYLTREE